MRFHTDGEAKSAQSAILLYWPCFATNMCNIFSFVFLVDDEGPKHGHIRDNSLAEECARAELHPGHWAHHALLHMAAECVRYLPDRKEISATSQTVATAWIAPKICQPSTFGSQYSRFHPNRFTFGGVIAERANAVLWGHGVFAIFAPSKALLPVNKKPT